jgi:hypothetical protein
VAGVVKDTPVNPIGLNMSAYCDDEAQRVNPVRTLSATLTDMGVKWLRFPGGWESDHIMWSIPPYTTVHPYTTLEGPNVWPANDATMWNLNTHTWVRPNLDFSEFMALRPAGAIVNVVVCYNSIYLSAGAGGDPFTFQEALDLATAWVTYNKNNNLGVKYWSIGNEPWVDGISAAQYGQDVAVFAQAMKAIDPIIKIGLDENGGKGWFDGAMPYCHQYIDFIDMHNYPTSSINSFGTWCRSGVDTEFPISRTKQDIVKYPAHNPPIEIYQTETGIGYGFTNYANTGGGLVLAEILGELARNVDCKMVETWCTRWFPETPTKWYDTLLQNNAYSATGQIVKLMAANMLSQMVAATSTARGAVPFAAYDPATKKLNIWLINATDGSSTATTVNVGNYTGATTGARWVYKGTSSTDANPTYSQDGNVTISGGKVTLTLAPYSVTLLQF